MTLRHAILALLLPLLLGTGAGCKRTRGNTTAAPDAAPGDAAAPEEASAAPGDSGGAPADDSIPPTSSDELTARARHLLEAISKDDVDLATDIVFPRAAWLSLRDVAKPADEWDKRVDRPFRRSVHGLSKHTDGAHFVSLELGHAVVQEAVHHHGWKKPLWTVHGSRLTYEESGHTRTITIREMTAWRGAWYVTRLR